MYYYHYYYVVIRMLQRPYICHSIRHALCDFQNVFQQLILYV